MGTDALLQHAIMEKHRKKAIASKSQCTLNFKKEIKEKVEQTKESGLAYSIPREASLQAEIIWSLHTAYTNLSYRSCDGIQDTLVAMIPDSDVAKKMTLQKGKVSYIVSDGLGPVLLKQLLKDITLSGAYTLHYDKATLLDGKKQLDLHVRY